MNSIVFAFTSAINTPTTTTPSTNTLTYERSREKPAQEKYSIFLSYSLAN